MRYKYIYGVFPRGWSKSFLAVLILMIRAILYPGCRLFSTAGGKNQAASILQEKIQDICKKIPAFSKEIDWSRGGGTKAGKDYVSYKFKSGSTIENLAARESSRGQRFHSGLIEECIGVDQNALQQIIIPTMNVSRLCADGTIHEEEVLNQAQIFINNSDIVKQLTKEKPLNCWKVQKDNQQLSLFRKVQRLSHLRVELSNSKRRSPIWVKIQSILYSNIQQL